MKEMTKCKNATKYKGKREPTCGCDWCTLIWYINQLLGSNDAAFEQVASKINEISRAHNRLLERFESHGHPRIHDGAFQ
jgi:hypothetical protein